MTVTDDLRQDQDDALAGRLFQTTLAALDLWAIYLGHHLRYYETLAGGPKTSSELAAKTGRHERYTREWLEQQAVTGILGVDDAGADAQARRYRLGPGAAEILTDSDRLGYGIPLVRYFVAAGLLVPGLIEVYRTGGGIAWTGMGDEVREAQEGFNRAIYQRLLTAEDLPGIADIDRRLRADPPARVADIGCGSGWSAIAIAKGYPKVRVDGFDVDPSAIATARQHALEEGVADQVRFEVRQADDPTLDGLYDLVCFFECLHDIGRPVEALAMARRLLAPGGAVIVMDERVAETFAAPGDDIDRFMYGWSIVQCLPGGMADQPSAGTGAVMRPATLRAYATQAGFADVEVLPIDNDPVRRWYRLHP
jgi:2-polyprenyl-3-methyl-5-hydroxy-6-metoxy-1,4-benzoquinol methylase